MYELDAFFFFGIEGSGFKVFRACALRARIQRLCCGKSSGVPLTYVEAILGYRMCESPNTDEVVIKTLNLKP